MPSSPSPSPSTSPPRPRPAERRAGSVRQLVLFSVACVCVFGYLAASLFYTLPSNALSSRHSQGARQALNVLTPENWAFFTRNPETVQTGVYAYQPNGAAHDLLDTPQGAPSNLFGLSRTQRAQGPELAYLSASAISSWTDCAGFLDACLRKEATKPAKKADNGSPVPTICGDAYLTQEKTVPWSYRQLVSYDKRVVKIAHLDVRCT
ncbi:SdpA family antimicrobial peptide system protein [Streptomyces sp. NPDC057654]|uniref:SdpA family antimicrobial peptide system protein n=1 Tax=Streptomyces sp. NPDC057654 TaxID=3346196 RepID=UPI0036B888EE